jgi:uncharacterized RDD family membrane protein YckC
MRTFSARETEWLLELDGIELAGFWQRAIALLIDSIIVSILFSAFLTVVGASIFSVERLEGKSAPVFRISDGANVRIFLRGKEVTEDRVEGFAKEGDKVFDVVTDVVVPVLYFGILLWKGKGRTPGKRIMKIRVVSLMHRHITFWHAVERALGYGAAALELGFGFFQFFIHPYRRCAQDRLAETIVVTESSYQALQHKLSHPLIPDGSPEAPSEAA